MHKFKAFTPSQIVQIVVFWLTTSRGAAGAAAGWPPPGESARWNTQVPWQWEPTRLRRWTRRPPWPRWGGEESRTAPSLWAEQQERRCSNISFAALVCTICADWSFNKICILIYLSDVAELSIISQMKCNKLKTSIHSSAYTNNWISHQKELVICQFK